MRRRAFVILIALLLVPTIAVAAALITNGGFEGGYHDQAGIEGRTPDGWTIVNLTGNPTHDSTAATSGSWVEKIEGADSHRIKAEKFDQVGGGLPFNTVLYQQIEGLKAGTSYSAAGWFLSLWGGSARPENDSGAFVKRIGIDPTGGTDPEATSVVWSAWDADDKDWRNLSVAATPAGAKATIFAQMWHKEAMPNTDAILDAFEFREAPTVEVVSLPAYATSSPVTLSWDGTLPDHITELGPYALYYEVQQKNDVGTWTTLADELTDETYALPAMDGERLVLRVVPKSFQPREIEPSWPPWTFYGQPSPAMTTTVDLRAPSITVQAPLTTTGPFDVAWQGDDAGSGIAGYDVQWRRGDGDWRPWFTDTQAVDATFGLGGEPAAVEQHERYQVRVRARDEAGHVSSWQEAGWTYVTDAALHGRLLDVDGKPMIDAPTIDIEPYPFAASPPAPNQFGELATGVVTEPMTISVAASDGTSLPPTYLTVSGTQAYEWRLPPADNVITDGNFEGDGSDWGGSDWSLVDAGHTGHSAAQLSAGGRISQTVDVPADAGLGFVWRGEGLAESAVLLVTVGETSTEVPLGNDGWTYAYLPLNVEGTLPISLSLEGTASGTVTIDEVSIGMPRPAPSFVFLPLMVR